MEDQHPGRGGGPVGAAGPGVGGTVLLQGRSATASICVGRQEPGTCRTRRRPWRSMAWRAQVHWPAPQMLRRMRSPISWQYGKKECFNFPAAGRVPCRGSSAWFRVPVWRTGPDLPKARLIIWRSRVRNPPPALPPLSYYQIHHVPHGGTGRYAYLPGYGRYTVHFWFQNDGPAAAHLVLEGDAGAIHGSGGPARGPAAARREGGLGAA